MAQEEDRCAGADNDPDRVAASTDDPASNDLAARSGCPEDVHRPIIRSKRRRIGAVRHVDLHGRPVCSASGT